MPNQYIKGVALLMIVLLSPSLAFAASKRKPPTDPALIYRVTLPNGKGQSCVMTPGGSAPGTVKKSRGKYYFTDLTPGAQREIAKLRRKTRSARSQRKADQLEAKLNQQIASCAFFRPIPLNPEPPQPPTPPTPPAPPPPDSSSVLQPAPDRLSLEAAHHLFRRAGFGATQSDLDFAMRNGLTATVDKLLTVVDTPELDAQELTLLDGDPEPQSPPDKVTELGVRLAFLNHMWKSPNQLREKMAYFFHDLWAASSRSVPGHNGHFVLDYYRILRRNALGNIKTLAQQMTINGMMLYFLDGRLNRVGAVNENYAREFWELYTLGEGNYTEADIAESARAFTGWSVAWNNNTKRDEVIFTPAAVDQGNKVIFAGMPWQQTGPFNAQDLVNITFNVHPAAARHYARALYKFFVKVNPTEPIVDNLAALLRASNFEVAPAVRRILLSQEFFSDSARRAGVKTPTEYALGVLRNTGLPLYDIRYIERASRNMGQTLMQPPSVKGWDDNEYWLNDQWLMYRASWIHTILNEDSPDFQDFSLAYLLPSPTANSDQFLRYIMQRIDVTQSPVEVQNITYYLNYLRQWNNVEVPWLFDPRHEENYEKKARGLLYILMQDESYQME